ncbi:tyrosine-type recombinase/integrase [Rhodococcus tukisamuensis]|uniref:Site-specific recombinase XerD n=1 Tax=Rhodococcus tukisamuensis TaxID=168276 RepID=A0A1G6QNX3_9NOCA|nr:tyrosine-type recombinase/integrase [Rhodococcus tukisamuensis]SDC93347.1 Site-specific recombinase XerD [Rhodococcus tukisamuensis]
MRVQLVIAPHDESRSWTLLDDDLSVLEPVESYLAHLSAIGRSPNTVRAYAHDLKDFFTYLRRCELVWDQIQLEDVGRFIPWLGLSDDARRGGTSTVPLRGSRCSAVTVNRKLSAVSSFYEFQSRHGVQLAESITAWQRQGQLAGSWEPFLAHLGGDHNPVRKRMIALKTDQHDPKTLTPDQVEAVIGACDRLRDRFLFMLLRSSGLRIGEALGLRHEDLNPRRGDVAIRARTNTNHARAKTRSRVVPIPARAFVLYSDYLHEEYGPLDSDYVFVNLWGQPHGEAMTYSAVHGLVCRIRNQTGIAFSPHTFRHTYATELLRQSVPAEVVRNLLGHASISTTVDTYGHLNLEDARGELEKAGVL